jgi:ATP-dependent DNA helicase RecG
MPIVRLADNNTLTLPPEVVDALGLRPGDSVEMIPAQNGFLLARSAPSPSAPIPASPADAASRAQLDTPLQFIKGVGPSISATLAKKGLVTVEDALYHVPLRYEDRRELRPIAKLRPGSTEVFSGLVVSADVVTSRGGRRFFEALVQDATGTITLKWFNYHAAYMKKTWQKGRQGVFSGEVSQFGYQREVHHPDVEWFGPGEELEAYLAREAVNFGRIVPVYPLTEGVQQRSMRLIMRRVVEGFAPFVTTTLPGPLIERRGLLPLAEALREIHQPGGAEEITQLNSGATRAHRSLVFDEFFYLELGLALKRQGIALEEGISFQVTHRYTRELLHRLPFPLTNAQRRVLSEIKGDMMAPHPMHRLVQGDVGSGKTLIALLAALIAVENDYQVAFMAPTELLAEQHFLNVHRSCEELGVRVVLVTSSMKGKARTAALAAIAGGETHIVIGTHAVIQEKVEFRRLGLGIIDEQHRFGVLQRSLLRKKGANPDILVMTATPIPRTLAMTVFGDLSLSVVDELPPGRTPVETGVFFESRRFRVYELIREEVAKGRQAYVIYPLVEESAKSELKAATQMAEHLASEVFPELRVGLLHGRLRPEEKETTMRSFKEREIDILVATTVIEVGIDVPNATIMVIEHAERFGLSQLHQLRGRVGRGSERSRCLLLTNGKLSEDGEKRLRVMAATGDGFRIAEEDLAIRGPGDFLGTRQAGLPDFRVANILRDGRLLEEARDEAFAIVEKDPTLSRPEHGFMREELARRWGRRLELAGIA